MDERSNDNEPAPNQVAKHASEPAGLMNPYSQVISAQEGAVQSLIASLRDSVRTRDEVMQLVIKPVVEAQRVQHEIFRSLVAPLREAERAREEIARLIIKPILDAQRIQDAIRRSVFDTLRDGQRAREEMTRAIAEVSGIAARLYKLASYNFATNLDSLLLAAQEQAERLEAEGDRTARDDLFAGYDGDEYLPERGIVDAELAKIPGFDGLPTHVKFLQVLRIAADQPSPRVQDFALAMAANLLANLLGQGNSLIWLTIFLFIAAIFQISSKLRVPKTRQLLRTMPIDARHMRIAGRTCGVCDRPKSKALRIGRLELGGVVTITDKLQGWRQVHFLDDNGRHQAGWVRSKYLRKV